MPIRTLIAALALLIPAGLAVAADKPGLIFACRADNDLYRVAQQNLGPDHAPTRYDNPAEAIAKAPDGAGVLLLADGYPQKQTPFDASLAQDAAKKKLRLFIEYPAWLPELQLGQPQAAAWTRTVVASDAFGPALPKMRILMVQDCRFLPVKADHPHLVLARVSGYDCAVFGLPPQMHPILFEHRGLLVSTTKLSQFVTGRYAPVEAWPPLWAMVMRWLGAEGIQLKFTPTVHPSYDRDQALPADAQLLAIRRGTDWYTRARLPLSDAGRAKMDKMPQEIERVDALPPADQPIGDGSQGILEAFSSSIAFDGSQPIRWYVRNDCCGESAMALALRAQIDKDEKLRKLAANVLDYINFKSIISQGPRADEKSPSFGLMGWDDRPMGAVVYYGDDNARSLLGQIAVAAVFDSDRWNERMLRCMLANFRTTGPSGYRQARIEEPELQQRGWRWFWDKSDGSWGGMRHSAHYQAYGWAVNLWLYDKTRFKPLLERTRKAIRHQMTLLSEQWHHESNRHEAERVRMLLPLAWLVRVDDTPEHRAWLKQITQYVIEAQDPTGAIRQRVTASATTNEQYGTGECPLIHATGDPCTDLLYTTNFALIGLREAAAATGDADTKRAEDRLADFLIRVQARSETRPEFDGAWFRGFDYRKWDYWGSNGDIGWGVWATESGWTQGWITATLALRHLNTSLWDFSKQSTIAKNFDAIRRQMMPDDCFVPAQSLDHAARGKSATLDAPPAPQYGAEGPASLTDGQVGQPEPGSPEWLGYEGRDFACTLDLGQPTEIRSATLHCLLHPRSGVFPPSKVTFSISDDGKSFTPAGTVDVPPPQQGAPARLIPLSAEIKKTARYLRVKAKNSGPIPAWQAIAPGVPSWLFVDEVMVNPTDAKQ